MDDRMRVQDAEASGAYIDGAVCRAWRRIPSEIRVAALTAFAGGVLTHAYMLFNKLPNHDDLTGTFTRNEMTSLGRWFLSFASSLSSRMSVPWVNGMLAIGCLALSAALIVYMLRIRGHVFAGVTALLLVTFPTLANTFAYMFTADGYMIGLLLAILGAAITDRCRCGFLWGGGVLIALSMGTYQAYIGFAVALWFIRIFCMVVEPETTIKSLARYILRCAGALALGLVLYYAGLNAMLAYRGVALTSYQGINQTVMPSIASLCERLINVYLNYIRLIYNHNAYFGNMPGRLLFLMANAGIAIIGVRLALRCKNGRAFRLIAVALLILSMPLAFNCIYLAGAEAVHELMRYPLCLVHVLLLVLIQRDETGAQDGVSAGKRRFSHGLSIIATVLMLLFCVRGAAYSNNAYLFLQLNNQSVYGLVNRVLSRIEAYPAYAANQTPVYVSGKFSEGSYAGAIDVDAQQLAGTVAFGYGEPFIMLLNDYHFRQYARYYLGVQLVAPNAETVNQIVSSAEYATMPLYPAEGSICLLDGVIVVKAN